MQRALCQTALHTSEALQWSCDDFVADGKEEFDSRDIHRVRTNTNYVSKFVRQVEGDENKAYNMLVCHVYVSVYVHTYVRVPVYVCIYVSMYMWQVNVCVFV